MKTFKKTILIAVALSGFSLPEKSALATVADPFSYYTVFSAGDISYNNSGFQGTVGAGGQVILTSVTLAGPANGFAMHAGGNVSVSGGSHTGSIETAGNAALGSLQIHGNVYSGGTLSNTAGGHIYGGVSAQSITLDQYMAVDGQKQSGVAYSPHADLAASSNYFRKYSQDVAAMGGSGATVTNSNGLLQTSLLSSGINVVNISSSELNSAYKFNINGPADAKLYINVSGANAALNYTLWNYLGGIASSDVLINYFEASRLDLTSTNNVNILAPLALTTFTGGTLTGNLIVGNLSGTGQVNPGDYFDAPETVPEPSTFLLLLLGGLPFLLRKKIRS